MRIDNKEEYGKRDKGKSCNVVSLFDRQLKNRYLPILFWGAYNTMRSVSFFDLHSSFKLAHRAHAAMRRKNEEMIREREIRVQKNISV